MMMTALKKLPGGNDDFRSLVTGGKVYVDKTDLIAKIAACNDATFFLSRPRRFGKSTLVSTFHELFANGTECFSSLKLGREGLWHDHTYPVLRLNFSACEPEEGMTFTDAFAMTLEIWAHSSGLGAYWQAEQYWLKAFTGLLDHFDSKSLVLLIDEYDAPLTACLQKPEVLAERQLTLSTFFTVVKEYAYKFRFVFITGVARFSVIDTLIDLSFDPDYGALTGFTEAELSYYFTPYIEFAAQALAEEYPHESWNADKVREKLKENYGGYCFDSEASVTVYNPWSLFNFFDDPKAGFRPYWAATGGSSNWLLEQCLQSMERFSDQEGGLGALADFLADDYTEPCSSYALQCFISIDPDRALPFVSLLFQAGYFTIKGSRDKEDLLLIGIPNDEVLDVYADVVIEDLAYKKNADRVYMCAAFGGALRDAFKARDCGQIRAQLNRILNLFSADAVRGFLASSFRDVLKLAAVLLHFNCASEEGIAGRSDLRIKTDDAHIILEFKLVRDAEQAEDALEEAKQQIKEARYAQLFTDKEVVALAAVIVAQPQAEDEYSRPKREIALLERVC